MRSFVYFEVLTPREHFPAPGEGAREWLLARVHPNVVDQFVLCLERASVPRTVLPAARVVRALRAAHVLDGDVRHDLVHRAEDLVAGLPRGHLVAVDPQAGHLVLDGVGPQVPVEGPGGRLDVVVVRVVGVREGVVVVSPGHLVVVMVVVERVRPAVHVGRTRQRQPHLVVVVGVGDHPGEQHVGLVRVVRGAERIREGLHVVPPQQVVPGRRGVGGRGHMPVPVLLGVRGELGLVVELRLVSRTEFDVVRGHRPTAVHGREGVEEVGG